MKKAYLCSLLLLSSLSACGQAENEAVNIKRDLPMVSEVRASDDFSTQAKSLSTVIRLKESPGNLFEITKKCVQDEKYKPFCKQLVSDVNMALALYSEKRPSVSLDQLMSGLALAVSLSESRASDEVIISSPSSVKKSPDP